MGMNTVLKAIAFNALILPLYFGPTLLTLCVMYRLLWIPVTRSKRPRRAAWIAGLCVMIPLSVVVTYACNRYVLSDKYTFHSLDGRLVAHGRIWWPINPFDIFNSFEQRCVEVAVGGTERFWPCEVLTFAVSHVFVEDADPITVTFESNRCVRVTVAEANLQYVLQRQ